MTAPKAKPVAKTTAKKAAAPKATVEKDLPVPEEPTLAELLQALTEAREELAAAKDVLLIAANAVMGLNPVHVYHYLGQVDTSNAPSWVSFPNNVWSTTWVF